MINTLQSGSHPSPTRQQDSTCNQVEVAGAASKPKPPWLFSPCSIYIHLLIITYSCCSHNSRGARDRKITMPPLDSHDDDEQQQTAGGGGHRTPPPNMLTFSTPPPSSTTCITTTTANPSGAVHPTTSSPSSATARLRPVAANSFPLVLKFEEVVYKVKVGQPAGGWCARLSSACAAIGGGEGKKKKAAVAPPREKTIINGMSGVVRPGEMLAMLGPSGSGKTTLLTALGGRTPRRAALLSGKITYNGQPFSGAVKRRTGFVTQHDVLYPHLTVSETLWYTALLRLPRALGAGEKRAQADAVMLELGLAKVAHSMIGGVRGVRGLSGGERKRVSIGLEMLVDPSLLLLDEPTSGLDSTTAARIVGTLRRMAADGRRTVVVTIHQPSSRLYHMFDKVLLLSADGCPIYYGRAADALSYFASVGFASPLSLNPADLMLDLANGITLQMGGGGGDGDGGGVAVVTGGGSEGEQKEVRGKLAAAYERHIAPAVKLDICSREAAAVGGGGQAAAARRGAEEWTTGWWAQFSVLLRRGLKERRHESFNKLRIFQVLSVASLAGLLWWRTPAAHLQDRTALIFFFSVFWGFFPLYNAVFTFPLERPMLLKERSSGMYRLSSYFAARTAADLPMELGLPTAFVLILYWMGGLDPRPASFLLSLLVVLYSVLVAQSLGLAIGAVVMDVKQGTTLASVITMVFLIAGGYYVQHIPPFVGWLRWLNYSFYCYRLLVGIQFWDGGYYECGGALCPVAEFPAIKAVGLTNHWVDVCVMALMLLGYRVVAYIALDRLKPR